MVKGDAITLTCEVDDLGRPEAEEYVWTRAGHVVRDVTTSNWTIDPETEANISCVAVNVVGEGEPDFINIEVFGEFRISKDGGKPSSRILFVLLLLSLSLSVVLGEIGSDSTCWPNFAPTLDKLA